MSSAKVADRIARSAERRQLRNSSTKTRMKTAVSSAEKLISGEEAKSAREGVTSAVSSIGRAVSKRVIHRNRGARLQSRLARKLNQAAPKKKKKGG